MKVFVAWSVDQHEGLIAASLMSDNAEELRQMSQDLKHATENLKAWAMAVGGSPILDLGTVGAVEVPADRMTELPGIAEKFSAAVDATLSVGVGMTLSEAYTAMKFAAIKGGDQIALYHVEMEHVVMGGEDQPHDELEGLGKNSKTGQEEAVGFADGPSDGEGSGDGGAQHGGPNPAEGDSPVGSAPDTSPGDPGSVSIDMGSDDGDPNGGQMQGGGGKGEESEDPRAAVVQALQQIKQQAPVLEQMKRTNPQAFEAVKAVVDAMILMAQGMAAEGSEASGASGSAEESGGESVSKSEDLVKGWGDSKAVHETEFHEYHIFHQEHANGESRHAVIAVPKNKGKKMIHLGHAESHEAGLDRAKKHGQFAKEEMKDLMPGGRGDNMPDSEFDSKDLKTGQRREQAEHGLDPARAKEVAKDHLVTKPDEYEKAEGDANTWAVGTQKDGKVKVRHQDVATGADGGTAWRSVRAGQIMSEDGHAISARNPSGK